MCVAKLDIMSRVRLLYLWCSQQRREIHWGKYCLGLSRLQTCINRFDVMMKSRDDTGLWLFTRCPKKIFVSEKGPHSFRTPGRGVLYFLHKISAISFL